jgi:hypothetical protein
VDLYLYWSENATEAEIEFWEQFKASSAPILQDAQFEEASTRAEWNRKADELGDAGWTLIASGDGYMARMTVFTRS